MRVGRRGFLKTGLVGGGLLLVGGSALLALRRTRIVHTPTQPLRFFTPEQFAIFAAVAERIIPGGERHGSASELHVAEACDVVMARAEPGAQKELKQLLGLFDSALAAFVLDLRLTPFTHLDPEGQDQALERWRRSRITLRRSGFQALKRLACACYYGNPRSYASIGYAPPVDAVQRPEPPPSAPARKTPP